MKEDHSLLHRHDLLLHACTAGTVTADDWDVLKQAGLGSCLLHGLPQWTVKYAAGVVWFCNIWNLASNFSGLKAVLKLVTLFHTVG